MNDKQPFAHKKLLIAMIILIALVLSALLFSRVLLSAPAPRFSLRAIIVDQLSSEFPNPVFGSNGTVANDLKSAGFDVSYVASNAVNVDFYTRLAQGDYGIIIVRAHSAMRVDSSTVDFFTSEAYSSSKYGSYQQDGRVTVGSYSWRPGEYFFAVSPELIRNLDGTFPKSIVVAMGCDGLNSSALEMADAFINKGALAFTGWNGLVGPDHTDNETLKFLDNFLVENKTLSKSVRSTALDPDYLSVLGFYPSSAENLTKNDLLADAEGSKPVYGIASFSGDGFSATGFGFLAVLVMRRCRVLSFSVPVHETVVMV